MVHCEGAYSLSDIDNLWERNEGVCQRATFIIDPSGLVKAMDIHDNDIGRNINEVYRKFESAKYVQDHKGEVSPASWQPGQKTIKPGIKLVGKI